MSNRDLFLESAYFYMQASKLIVSTLSLQRQIQRHNQQLMLLIGSSNTPLRKQRIYDLRDEIFSCKIEIEALRLKANRLFQQARAMRSDDVLVE